MLKAEDRRFSDAALKVCGSQGYWPKSVVIWCKSGRGGASYLLAQEWAVLLLSLALATVRKFMVTELLWLTLHSSSVVKGLSCNYWENSSGVARTSPL